jgi:plastocyanin
VSRPSALRWVRRACVLGVGLLGINCRDSTAPRYFAGHVAFAPAFKSSNSSIVNVDRVRITLVGPLPAATQALDTVITIPPGADSVDLSLTVPLASSPEDFDLYLRLLDPAGDTVFRNSPYPQSVSVTAGVTGSVVPASLEYRGVGYDAVSVIINTPDTSVLFGDTLRLTATAYGSTENAIAGTPIAWRSLDTARVRVPNKAVAKIMGGNQRGPARIVAELLTGPADTMIVTAVPLPTSLTKVSGDGQTAVPLAPLALPLRVRVLGSDGLGVKVPVLFRALATGASVSADTVMSDSLGYAQVAGTLGPAVGSQMFDARVNGIANPVVFNESAMSGSVASVTLDRTVDTIARGATLQYHAVARDSLGNAVNVTIGWISTVPSVATVDTAGLATAVGVDSTRIIAGAAGHADTAVLYVRGLASVTVLPADTVITAIGDSFDLHATARDNFGGVVTSGFTQKFISATPTVVTVNAAGRTHSVGAGNGVVVVRDSVDPSLQVQATATVRVNQVVTRVSNALPVISIGVGGKGQVAARAFDRNGYSVNGRTFGYASRNSQFVTVDASGTVTGVALDSTTYVVDSLLEGANVYKDSTLVKVVTAPPALLRWGVANDSLAVGNGGSVSVPLTLSRTDSAARTIFLSSSDSLVARPTLGCGGGVLQRTVIPAQTPGTSVLVCGLKAGRVVIKAQDSLNVFAPDSMVVTVVSTIEFREVGSFSQQPYFYVNQNETHRAQVFLSDPAPAGGLGVTFVYGKPGTSAISPAPAIIPAGQLASDIVIQGIAPGTDSITPTSGGFVGKFSHVYVASNNLTIQRPYPYTATLGVGQYFQPDGQITYAMDHPLVLSASLSSGIGTVQSPDTIRAGNNYVYFTVKATAPGKTALTVAASGWVSAIDTLIFTTPRLMASGQTSLIAGNPSLGYWTVYSADSLRYQHTVTDTLAITAVSRNVNAVAVDSGTLKLVPGASGNTRYNALRALPSAGGDSAWIVLSAPGYMSDSFLVHVTKPTMSVAIGYPYSGRVGLGTLWKNGGYVQLPYVRPDTFTVTFTHTRAGAVRGPPSVRVLPNQTIAYFDLVGDTIGIDTMRVDTVLTTGYLITGTPLILTVDSLHVRPYQYPGVTNYTIGSPYPVVAAVYDSVDGQYRPLIAPLRVNLVSGNTATFTLDSAFVTIDSAQFYSYNHPDTLRFKGVDTAGARIFASAPGTRGDSSNLIKVFPTPLAIQLGYPYALGRGLRTRNNYVNVVGGNVPDTVKVALRRFDPTLDTLTADTVKIFKGQSFSQLFEIWSLDSLRTDSIVATAPGYVPGKITITPQAVSLLEGGMPSTRLTTDPPYRAPVYVGTRSGTTLNPFARVNVTVVSTDPTVMRIDSAFTVNATGDTAVTVVDTNSSYGYVRVQFVGVGPARLRYTAVGFKSDSTPLVSVSGPVLHLTTGNQTVGIGQLLPNQYVYLDNAVTISPLVVHLLRSDSTQVAANQEVFQLSADSVIIPVGQTSSNYFDIQGNFANSAVLTARAAAYGQSIATISVGQPQLIGPTNVSLYLGQQPPSYGVYTADQNGAQRLVAAALTVKDSSSSPTVATVDSAQITIPARSSYAYFPIRPRGKGAASVVFSAPGYKADTTVVSVDSGQLAFGSVPAALGPNQTAQMYVSLPFTNDSAVTVALGVTDPTVLSVPPSVVIPARQGYVYFNVIGQGAGSASVTATASIAKAGSSSAILVGQPKLFISATTIMNAGQRTGFQVYSQDPQGNNRAVTAPLTITLSSSSPAHTTFDSATVTIPANNYYANAGVVFDTAGVYTITASASANGYASGSATITVTGALVLIQPGGNPASFVPQTVTIKAGQYVTWRNTDAVPHTATDDNSAWQTGQIAPQTASGAVYFGAAGTFTYHCSIHPTMTGTVVVTP